MDQEIEEMAKKIRLSNENKMEALHLFSLALNNQRDVQNPCPETSEICVDWTSVRGQFGWTEIANVVIPYLTRSGEKFVSMRMAENKILVKFKNLFTDEVRECFRLKVHRTTLVEAQLLNEINEKHCDHLYGKSAFTTNDGIVTLADFNEMYEFLDFCYFRLLGKVSAPHKKCGFIQIGGQNYVPYVWHENKQYVPLFYFEGECKYLEDRCVELSGWSVAYLKLYCKIQGIRKALFEGDAVRTVELELLKKFFPPDTRFQAAWPTNFSVEMLMQRPVPKLVLRQAPTNGLKAIPLPGDASKRKAIGVEKITPTPQKKQVSSLSDSNLAGKKQVSASATSVTQTVGRMKPPDSTNVIPTSTTFRNIVPMPNRAIATTPNTADYHTFLQTGNIISYTTTSLVKSIVHPGSYQSGSRVIQIPEVACNKAYFVVRTQVEDKIFQYCINMEPFLTTILLVCLEEGATFFQLPLNLVVNAVNVMNLDIFLPNKMQKKELERFQMHATRGMLKLRDFIDNLPQLRYIVSKTKTFG